MTPRSTLKRFFVVLGLIICQATIISTIAQTITKEVSLPYSVAFESASDLDLWSIYDANNDGITWEFNIDSESVIYDGTTAEAGGDDWFISPKFTLDESVFTAFTINISNYYDYPIATYVIPNSPDNYANAERIYFTTASVVGYVGSLNYLLTKYLGEDICIGIRAESTDTKKQISNLSIYAQTAVDLDITTQETINSTSINRSYGVVNIYDSGDWVLNSNSIIINNLNITIAKNTTSPQLTIYGDSVITKTINIIRNISSGENNMISLPFDFDIENIIVNNTPVSFGNNLKLYTYDGDKRAKESYNGYTSTGWVEQSSGIIPANEGFAIAVNSNNGNLQEVIFSANNITFRGGDAEILLNRYESTSNSGRDADWNLFGNPHTSTVKKGVGYSIYQYIPSSNSYKAFSSIEETLIIPFTSVFTQSGDNFTSIIFNPSDNSISSSTTNINAQATLTINGDEDEAKLFVVDGTSDEYVTNEDAMYLNSGASKVAQIYYIDQNGESIASTVVPELYNSVTVAYQAVSSGTQSIAMTTDIYTTPIYLYDNITNQSTLMVDGAIYEFESAAGTFTNRFTLITEGETTGITTPTTSTTSNIKVITGSNSITICGAEIGAPISITTTNGTTIYNGTITNTNHRIDINTPSGVVIIKVGSEVVKLIFKD